MTPEAEDLKKEDARLKRFAVAEVERATSKEIARGDFWASNDSEWPSL